MAKRSPRLGVGLLSTSVYKGFPSTYSLRRGTSVPTPFSFNTLCDMTYIDTSFDFTTDSPNYWDGFWNRNEGRGAGGSDPDSSSPTLQKYHQILWSRVLPCGKEMGLVTKGTKCSRCLEWEDFTFTSDSIAVSHRYGKMNDILKQFEKVVPNYHAYMENFIHKAYTIGGMMIWPCRRGSINQAKGCNGKIADRIDRTLECVRRYYNNEESPMSHCLENDSRFFELFVDFKGFVDFFFFQDLVSTDYKRVNMMVGNNDFSTPALAQSVEEYCQWLETQLVLVAKRNERIKNFIEKEK